VLLTKNERGGGLGRRGVCGDLRAGDKAVRVSVGAGIVRKRTAPFGEGRWWPVLVDYRLAPGLDDKRFMQFREDPLTNLLRRVIRFYTDLRNNLIHNKNSN